MEQIQFLVWPVSVQTTERYFGCKQRIRSAVNDRIGIGPNILELGGGCGRVADRPARTASLNNYCETRAVEICLSALLPSSPRALNSIDRRGGRILQCGRKQLSPLQKSHGSLHSGLRQSRPLRQLLMAQRYDLLACTHAAPPYMEINKKRRRSFFMLGEIAHKHVKNVTIQEKVHEQALTVN